MIEHSSIVSMALALAIALTLTIVGQSSRVKVAAGETQQRGVTGTIAGVRVHNYIAGHKDWIVMFNPLVHNSKIREFCQDKCQLLGHPSEQGMAFAKVHGHEEELESMLTDTSVVDFIETEGMVYLGPPVDDGPEDEASLAEAEESESRPKTWGLSRIGKDSASTTGKGVNIYVMDTGIHTTHFEFEGRAFSALDMTADDGQGMECDGDLTCAADLQGHGTHCSGIAAGKSFGVASDATVFAVKTLDDYGQGNMSWQYAGIDWVTTKGRRPAVLSCSLGSKGKEPGYDAALIAASNAGVITVVAAGNLNIDTCNFSPAFSDHAITVGATDQNNWRAGYSDFGTCNDIFAPGSWVRSASPANNIAWKYLSGTSQATPHVSGAVALLLETDPTLSKNQVLAMLKKSAKKKFISFLTKEDPNLFLFVGRLDACRRRILCR